MSDFGGELDALASETGFSGVVRIDQSGRIELARAYGLAHRGFEIPNELDTRFGIASGAKGFTALAVVSLIEEGVLELSTTARSVLGGDLPLIDDRVTVEQLLAHRSGIGDYLDEDADWEPEDYVMPVPVHELAATEDYLAVLDGHASKFEPGERFAYCNGGFVVLALIAERASGVPFHELVAQRVCGPAGLTDTEFLRSDELPGRTATGYIEVDGQWRTNVLHLPVRGSGDGGIYSTAADIGSLWRALFHPSDRLRGVGRGAGAAPQRRAGTLEALRARLLAPRVERRRHPGRVRRRSVVPLPARPTHAGDSHRDLEHGWGRLADRSVSRECSVKLSDFSSCRPTETDELRVAERSIAAQDRTATPGGCMRLLLTSAGIKNTSIQAALVDLLGKPIADSNALCVPTAGYGHPQVSPERAWRFISGQEPRCPMTELGWKSLGVLELTALPSIDEERWVPWVQETDVLLVNGGDALYLCHWMRQSGLADLLPSLRATVWVGLSAGSMVMTPRIGEDFVGWKPPTGSDSTLGIVDFSIFPHLDNQDLPANTMAAAERWAAGIRGPGYAIDDETAIKVTDGTVDVVSEGHWKLFTS